MFLIYGKGRSGGGGHFDRRLEDKGFLWEESLHFVVNRC